MSVKMIAAASMQGPLFAKLVGRRVARIMRRRARLLAGLLAALSAGPVFADPAPAVIELFTSQGCSSCPPADQLLGELAQRPDVIALAYHVDYWDHLGWKDPFSSPQATARHKAYSRALHLSGIYTPQMVIDGNRDVIGSDRGSVMAALAARRDGVKLMLSQAGGKLHVAIGAGAAKAGADIILVAYSGAAETKIARGENAGKTLRDSNIVRGVQTIGHWTGMAAESDVDLSSLPHDADSAAILLQQPGEGAMLAAASLKILP